MKLPDGAGSITYLGYQQWVSLAITYDPGQLPALISGIAALAGLILSFLVRRRRVFVRAAASPDGSTAVTLGGLARSDAAGGFDTEFAELARLLRAEHDGRSMQAVQLGDGVAEGIGDGVAGGFSDGIADEPEDFDDQGRGRIAVPAGSSVTAASATAETAAAATPEALTGREGE
jgi:hypothetical protein